MTRNPVIAWWHKDDGLRVKEQQGDQERSEDRQWKQKEGRPDRTTEQYPETGHPGDIMLWPHGPTYWCNDDDDGITVQRKGIALTPSNGSMYANLLGNAWAGNLMNCDLIK